MPQALAQHNKLSRRCGYVHHGILRKLMTYLHGTLAAQWANQQAALGRPPQCLHCGALPPQSLPLGLVDHHN